MDPAAPTPEQLRNLVDEELDRFLTERRAALPDAVELVDEIAAAVDAGGKRLRPAFCYWGYRAAGGRHSDAIVRAASSLELLHTFALVHDDIMDGATRRRGRPSTFAARGLDFALLTGDLALVLADAAFMASGFDARDLVRAFDAYSRMRQEVIAGQYLDWRASTGGDPTPEEARRIAVLKSGRYTIQEPLVIGALLVGSNDSLISCLHAFGGPLGEAFQIRDDLLGTFGEADAVGKPVDSDIRGGKRNLLFASAVASLTGEDRAFFQSKWGGGGELSDDDVGRLRKLIESSGARAAAETELERLRREAFAALNECDMEGDARGALQELGRRAVTRTS